MASELGTDAMVGGLTFTQVRGDKNISNAIDIVKNQTNIHYMAALLKAALTNKLPSPKIVKIAL